VELNGNFMEGGRGKKNDLSMGEIWK